MSATAYSIYSQLPSIHTNSILFLIIRCHVKSNIIQNLYKFFFLSLSTKLTTFHKEGTVSTYFKEWKDTQGPYKTNLCATCDVHATSWSPLILSTKLPYFSTHPNPNPNNVWQPYKMTGMIIHLHIQLFTILEMVIINWITSSVFWIFFSPNCNTNLFSTCYCCSQIHT
jgi:hypothetical protein